MYASNVSGSAMINSPEWYNISFNTYNFVSIVWLFVFRRACFLLISMYLWFYRWRWLLNTQTECVLNIIRDIPYRLPGVGITRSCCVCVCIWYAALAIERWKTSWLVIKPSDPAPPESTSSLSRLISCPLTSLCNIISAFFFLLLFFLFCVDFRSQDSAIVRRTCIHRRLIKIQIPFLLCCSCGHQKFNSPVFRERTAERRREREITMSGHMNWFRPVVFSRPSHTQTPSSAQQHIALAAFRAFRQLACMTAYQKSIIIII